MSRLSGNIKKYCTEDVRLVLDMQETFSKLQKKYDLYHFLRLLGLKSPPMCWRTTIIVDEDFKAINIPEVESE